MFQATVYKIMIGCPSDIQEEINVVFDVLNEWNDCNSETNNMVLLPIHWSKSSFPEVGAHPQKILDKQLVDKSDLMVCIFWTKLGTPTDTDESGTIEEINEHIKAGKNVMMFFKNIVNASSVNFEHLKQVQNFKNRFPGLYIDFNDEKDFKDKFSKALQKYINQNWLNNKTQSIQGEKPTDKKFNDEEYDILRKWVNSGNDVLNIMGTGGDEHYEFGNKIHSPENGKDKAEYRDFIDRLEHASFIEYKGYNMYVLKKAAYDYVANQEKENIVNLSKRQQEILQVVADNKVLTIGEISLKTGMSDVAVMSNLTALQNMGLLIHEDGRKGGKWRVKTD